MPRNKAEASTRAQEKVALQSEVMPEAKRSKPRDRSTRIAQAAAKQTQQAEVIPLKGGERKRLKREAERHQLAHQPRDKEHYFRPESLEMRACACCGELTFLNKSKVVVIDDAWARLMRDRLPWTEDIPQGLRDDYDLSKQAGAAWDFLSGVPLSERGIVSIPAGPPRLRFCLPCFGSLNDDRCRLPPRKAFANGWAIGKLPVELLDTTWAEWRLVTIAPVCGLVKVVGRDRLKTYSHLIANLAQKGPPITNFPRDLPGSDFSVIYSGANEGDKTQARQKFHRVRRGKVGAFFSILKRQSKVYRDCRLSAENLAAIPEDGEGGGIEDDGDDNSLIATAAVQADRVGSVPTKDADVSTEAQVGLVPIGVPNDDDAVAEWASGGGTMRRFRIKNGDGFSREQEVNHYSAAFPRHFMWGHGTPNCSRMVAFGKEAAFRRFLLQGDRTMAQDCTFVLKAFDEISRKQFHRRIFLQLRANPSVASSAMTMTKEELDIAMRHYQAVEHAARTSRPPPADPSAWTDTGSAKQVLGLVQRAAGKAFGSKEERIDMGHHAIAMYTLHGRPHRMLTVTPSDSNSVWIAHHSGLLNFTQENPESFKELFDLEAMKKFPSEKAIRSACNKDPVLCAVKFDHMIKEYIIPVVLGWDMEAGRSFPGCGEFNELNGFVASVESQGDKAGTLHAHILIWEKTRDERPDSVRFKTAADEAGVWSAWKQVQKKSVDENGKDIV